MRNRAKESFLIIMITMFVFRKQKNRKWKSEWKKNVCVQHKDKKNAMFKNRTEQSAGNSLMGKIKDIWSLWCNNNNGKNNKDANHKNRFVWSNHLIHPFWCNRITSASCLLHKRLIAHLHLFSLFSSKNISSLC